MTVRHATAAAALAAMVLAGCGGGSSSARTRSKASDASSSTTAGAGVTPTTGGTGPSHGSTGGGSAGTGGPAGAPTTTSTLPTTIAGAAPAPLEATMQRECVIPGGAQSITVRSTPGFQVSFGTLWPDRGGHVEWNAWGVGEIPPNGAYVRAWTVPPAAPRGTARTDVSVTSHDGKQVSFAHPTWRIADHC